jgi:hypothetical protein
MILEDGCLPRTCQILNVLRKLNNVGFLYYVGVKCNVTKNPCTHLTGDTVGTTASLDVQEKKTISYSWRISNPRIFQTVA